MKERGSNGGVSRRPTGRVQAATNKIDVVQSRDDGEHESGAQKCFLGYPYPPGMVHLQQHHEDHRSQLCEGVGFAKDAWTEITEAGNGVKHRADKQNANITAEYQHSELPGN